MLNNIAALLDAGIPAATNSYESIMTTLVGSGGSSAIAFTTIPATYKHLQIRMSINNSGADAALFTFNSDSGSNYIYHRLVGNGTSATAAASSARTSIPVNASIGFPSGSNIFGGSIMDILDYTSTNKNKTTRTLSGQDSNGSGGVEFDSGLWFATPAAITRIDIVPAVGTFSQYSSFALYGIKG